MGPTSYTLTQDTLTMKSYQKRESSSNGVAVMKRQSCFTKQEVRPFLIGRNLIDPISDWSKLLLAIIPERFVIETHGQCHLTW